jgi:hypothetical protein
MKKRSNSQKIGTKGENAFRDFAERNGLVVTKADEDFGTDFFCVLESNPNASGLSAITGNVIGAFVRATSGRRARIVIERSDAGHLLAARFPVSILMTHRPRSPDERIFFRFIDRVIAMRLAEFLKTKQETLKNETRNSDVDMLGTFGGGRISVANQAGSGARIC